MNLFFGLLQRRRARFRLHRLAIGSLGVCAATAIFACAGADKEAIKPKIVESTETTVSTGSPEKSTAVPSPLKESALDNRSFGVRELQVKEELGQTTVRVKFSTDVTQYRHFTMGQPARIVLDVFGDANRQSAAETFRADTHWVGTIRWNSNEGYVRIVTEIAAATVPAYLIDSENGGLKIVIGPANPTATAKKEIQLVQGGKRADMRVAEAKPEVTAPPPAIAAAPGSEKKYSGERISLDFKDADIKNVFRLLAEVSGLNIIVTPDVSRKVTVRLVEVPWDQALDLLIDTNGLGKEQIGNVVRISTAAQIKTERDALAAAKKSEENLEDLQTVYLSVNYARVKDLEAKIKPLLSARGTVVTDERSNIILVRDIKKAVDDANTLVSRLDTRTPQVLIESNLIETTPTFARALGVRLQFRRGGTTFGTAAGAGTPFSALLSAPGGAPIGLGGVLATLQDRVGGIQDLASVLQAAENEGNIRIISRPSIVTLNNVVSTIQTLTVLRIALPSSTNIASGSGAAAGTAVATEKVPVGVILTVTPQVSSDGFVLMNISVKSSSISPNATISDATGGVIPFDELTREAIANVLVRDGETIVIGGILKDRKENTQSGVPYLKDIPVLGWLFKNIRWQKNFEELMVFITPRILTGGSENLPSAEQLWRNQMKKTDGG